MTKEKEYQVTITLPSNIIIEDGVNIKKGERGFQRVKVKVNRTISVRFNEDEFKEIEELLGNKTSKSAVVRKVFMGWVRTALKNKKNG